MSAPPGDAERSRLSVMCQNWAAVKQNFIIPGGAFLPKPDVNVGVVTLTPLVVPYIDHPYQLVEKVVTTVFHGKRKNVINTIRNLFPRPLANSLGNRILNEKPSLASYKTRSKILNLSDPYYEDGQLFEEEDENGVVYSQLHE